VGGGERRFHALLEVLQRGLGLRERHVAVVDEPFGVELAHRALLADLGVHDRLGVGRLVRLVVAQRR